ncbi:MAG: hypothetical protein KDE19_12625, partial [Caldilineaceae bacterium]|nr:hypothetical protein [Caldilineaceae bacterium]
MTNNMHLQSAPGLANILWIGGPPDAGKTTVAAVLAQKCNMTFYDFDRYVVPLERLDRAQAPRVFEWFETPTDELWQRRSPQEIAAHTWESWQQVFPVQVQDLLTYAQESLVIAEGSVFLPHLVAPLLTSRHQAIWLFPTEQFKTRSFHERGKDRYSTREKNSDPALATSNFYARDLILSDLMRQDVE